MTSHPSPVGSIVSVPHVEPGTNPTETVSDTVSETGSAVSMPAAILATTPGLSSKDSPASRLRVDTDNVTVSSAPAVVVDVEGEVGRGELEDILTSPHGNNAIVQRSPGGRYVQFMEKLGSGASKDVYRAYDTQEGIEVAWNIVHLAGVPKNERNRIVNEVRLLERLHHHNIISFHGSWVNREKQQVNFITEILSSGTLKSFINKVQVIRWKIAKRWATQILKGLEYLHSQEPPVIHRDLKCENIFINGTSGDLRIGDLGLSTVHRNNGKALSVLGTPEFMAPDMYEESAYDEKVDIYAFGMCLLEIFTKEIPYRECSNPAQIYKKVTRGDPPDSLRRLESRHAREFIEMCLGTKDDDGHYMRPSATELLNHPFLQQRPADNDEVEVDPPIQERTIREIPESSSSGKGSSKPTRSQNPKQTEAPIISSSPRTKMENRSNSLDEDESDRFDEMPDTESSIRNPKVLMGRGQELHRDEDPKHQIRERQGSGGVEGEGQAAGNQRTVTRQSSAATVPLKSDQADPSKQQAASAMHYLVAAAVIEDDYPSSQPYEDDILKLVVTLPVEGQTQNVQFDFHLVEDDAIQVAKEMVAELGIPLSAVLELSETISGLARAARVKQEKYRARTQNKPSGHARSLSQGVAPQNRPDMVRQQQTIGHAQGQAMMPSQSHQSISEYMNTPQSMQGQQHVPQPVHQQQQGIAPQEQAGQVQGQQVAHHGSLSQIHGGHAPDQSVQTAHHGSLSQIHGGHAPDQSVQTAPPHLAQNHHQHTWNQQMNQNGPPSVQVGADLGMNPGQQAYGNVPPMQSLPPITRAPSNPGQPEVVPQATSYGQVPIQHVQMSNIQQGQSGGQQGMDGQGQPQVQYSHPSQGHMMHPGGQNGGPAPNSYAHQAQGHAPMPSQTVGQGMQMQGNGGQINGGYQGPPAEPLSQGQYSMQGSTHHGGVLQQAMHMPSQSSTNMHQGPQQNQNQQMQMLQQGAPGQGYGHGMGQAQPAPVGPTSQHQIPLQHQQHQMAPQHQQQLGQQKQQNPVQQEPMHGQKQALSHQGGVQSGNLAPPSIVSQPQQIVSAAGPSVVASPVEATKAAPNSSQSQAPTRDGGTEEGKITKSLSAAQPSAGIGAAVSKDTHMNGVHEVPSIENDDDDGDALADELLTAKLRKLDDDFKKNMMRAQRVFDTRMGSLQRTQVQREAIHQKTLEKHEKEIVDFEKRMHSEEIEQNRRIEQLQKDWAGRREDMRQKQLAEAQAAESELLFSSPAVDSGINVNNVGASVQSDDV